MPQFETPRWFKERLIPEGASLAGYSALIQALDVDVPLRLVACVPSASVREGGRAAGGLVLFGRLAVARRQKEFASLSDDEVVAVERIVTEAYV